MPQGLVKPANQIIVSGNPLTVEMEVGANATAAEMLPGALVIFDTVAQTVQEADDESAGDVGVLDVVAGTLSTTAYAVGDQVPVIFGDCICLMRLKASENVGLGDALVSGADGLVKKLAVGAMGAQGRVIGYAWEASNVTTIATIMVHFCPSAEAAAAS
jgi:hypothetical protein